MRLALKAVVVHHVVVKVEDDAQNIMHLFMNCVRKLGLYQICFVMIISYSLIHLKKLAFWRKQDYVMYIGLLYKFEVKCYILSFISSNIWDEMKT